MTALAVPIWCQRRDPLPDGAQDTFADTDCGEECVAMALAYRKGIALPAGVIRALIPGHLSHGETTSGDLVNVLRLFSVPCSAMEVPTSQVRNTIPPRLALGAPLIVLGNWLSPAVLHWILVVDRGSGKVGFNEPYYGVRRYEPWEWFLARYAGEIVAT